MTIDGAITQVAWLMNNYPRQYPANMAADRISAMAEQFNDSYSDYTDSEVHDVYKEFINERKDPPAISEVRNRLLYRKNNRSDAQERELSRKIIAAETYKRPDDLQIRNGIKGRMMHREAIEHFMVDNAAGALRGGSEYYFNAYPAVEFVPLGTAPKGD